ncbi:hypothetical protein M3Y99_01019600 [Aphelenchoides fujianensis]|nr:hypothetical protein M3Y99_01019600 [Aphelenchoides fujianensis]
MKAFLFSALLSTAAFQLASAQLGNPHGSHELPDGLPDAHDIPQQVPFPGGLPGGYPDGYTGQIPQPLPFPNGQLPNGGLPGGFPGQNPYGSQESHELPDGFGNGFPYGPLNDLPNQLPFPNGGLPTGSAESHELPDPRIPQYPYGFHPRRQMWSCRADTTADLACATWPGSAMCGCGTECAENHCKCKVCTEHEKKQ